MTIRKEFTTKELKQWYGLINKVRRGKQHDEYELQRLNIRIMEACHDIHNSRQI